MADRKGSLPSDWAAHEVKALCDRKLGVGADGVMVVTLRPDGVLDVAISDPMAVAPFVATAHEVPLPGRSSRASCHRRPSFMQSTEPTPAG